MGDDARGLAAVAAGDTGLHLLDIANLGAPTLVQTVAFNGPVGHLALRDGDHIFLAIGDDAGQVLFFPVYFPHHTSVNIIFRSGNSQCMGQQVE